MKLNTASVAAKPDTTTYEGAPAFSLSAKDELSTLVAASMLGEGTFYESGDDRRARIDALVAKVDPAFACKLAVYARSVWNLRTVSLYVVLSVAKTRKYDPQVLKGAVADVIQRCDEVREMLAGALTIFGDKKSIPQAIKRGIALAMRKFDQYGYAKYQGGQGAVKFRDVLRIVHPTPKNAEQSAVFAAIMADTLTMPEGRETWERIVSKDGSTAESWAKAAKETPYMATLRNLRNFAQNGALTDEVIAKIRDPKQVAKSRQLPIRFLSAARELEKASVAPKAVQAVMDAAELSLENVPLLGDNILVVVDVSGSMRGGKISEKSSLCAADVACLMGASLALATLRKGGNATLVPFATSATIVPLVPRDVLLRVTEALIRASNGGGTIIGTAWEAVQGKEFDAIVVFSDMQVMDGRNDDAYYGFRSAPRGTEPKAKLKVSFDLCGYGKTPFTQKNGWYLMGGWSDQALAALSVLRDHKGISKIVEAWEPPVRKAKAVADEVGKLDFEGYAADGRIDEM